MSRESSVIEVQDALASHFVHGFQSWWHQYIFHFSDITNIISILESGKLYSRNKAVELDLMLNDNADDSVIANTGMDAKDFVRFYFGGRTPTLYHNEGFKSKASITNNAHCPLPIYLLFDFVKLLSREDAYFSDGNIASGYANIYNDVTQLMSLEFQYIYHRDYILDESMKRHIIFCRHAEVLIPNEVNVYEYISCIYVRSNAEKETLLYSLSSGTKDKLKDKIFVGISGLFNANRLYVDEVYLDENNIKVKFSRATLERYEFTFTLTNLDTGVRHKLNTEEIRLENKITTIPLHENFIGQKIELQVKINGDLAYINSFDDELSMIL